MKTPEKSNSHSEQQTSDQEKFNEKKSLKLSIHMLGKMHSVYYLVETRKKTTIPLKTSPLWVESIWSLEAKEDTTDVMILSEQANESVQRCNWMNAENGENTCVNDPIPLGYIQFNSTTSRSKDLSVPILICFYQYFVGFFLSSHSTHVLCRSLLVK